MRIFAASTVIAAMSLLSVCSISALAITPPPIALAAAATSPSAETQLFVDGTNGSDANTSDGSETKPLKTIQKALTKAGQNSAKITIKGNFSLTESIDIPSNVTLSIDKDGATITGNSNTNDGITLKPGSTLRGDGELTMKNFKVALTAEKGSTITDGRYTFKDNGVKDGHGISLAGTVKGTSKDKLKIAADDKCDAIFYGPDVTFENATINVKSQTPAWTEAYDLTLKNSSLTVAGFGGPDGSGLAYYVNKLNMDNSEFVINKNGNGGHRTGLTIQGAATINNSRIIDNAGDHAGISVCPDAKLDVTNSTLEFNNNGEVGLNIHSGKVTLTNSAITGSTRTLYKAKDGGSIEPDSNSSIGESASKNEEASTPNVEHTQQEDIDLPADSTEKTPSPTPLPKENPNNKIVEKRRNENKELPKTGSAILLTAFSAILTFGLAGVIAQLKRIKMNKQ